ncbi:MAG: hypothetical protein COS94_01880, partial [Candidatus Hydrogenedentes bacterium CG07_land_8_20_14_0_80_42_17]
EIANWKVQIEIANWKVQIEKCKLKILFFQFSFFNYFTRFLREGKLHLIWRHVRGRPLTPSHVHDRQALPTQDKACGYR